ncbi:MAG: type II secretion system protein [Fibrobacterales bacterium]|nr:type II secretion system protein [Fibrobacterales bacterium]
MKDARGFSLIEALISIVITALMATVVARAIVDSRVAISNDEARNQANYKAARIVDSLRAEGTGGVDVDEDNTLNQNCSGAPLEHVLFSAGLHCLPCSDPHDHVQFVCAMRALPLDSAVSGRRTAKLVQVEVGWEIRKAPHVIRVEGVIE